MARGALRGGGGEACGDVIGNSSADSSRAGECGRVAAVAVCGIQRVIVVDVA